MAGWVTGSIRSTISFLDKRVEEIGIITLGLILISSMTFSILARYFVHTTLLLCGLSLDGRGGEIFLHLASLFRSFFGNPERGALQGDSAIQYIAEESP